jgi:hypothetical protein
MKRFKSISRTKKIIAAGATVALTLGIAGTAFAYFTAGGSGTGNAAVGAPSPMTVTVGAPTGGALLPSALGTGVIDTMGFTVTSPGGVQAFSTLTIEIAPGFTHTTGTDPACVAADFSINGGAVGTPYLNTFAVPQATPYTGSFTIQLVENGANQDSCISQSVPVLVITG